VVTGLGTAEHVRSAAGWLSTPIPEHLWTRLASAAPVQAINHT
jgi:hypothetical protein